MQRKKKLQDRHKYNNIYRYLSIKARDVYTCSVRVINLHVGHSLSIYDVTQCCRIISDVNADGIRYGNKTNAFGNQNKTKCNVFNIYIHIRARERRNRLFKNCYLYDFLSNVASSGQFPVRISEAVQKLVNEACKRTAYTNNEYTCEYKLIQTWTAKHTHKCQRQPSGSGVNF